MDSTIFVHCPKCLRKTNTVKVSKTMSKNGRPMLRGDCAVCKTKKITFTSMNKNNQEDAFFESHPN